MVMIDYDIFENESTRLSVFFIDLLLVFKMTIAIF